MPSERGGFRVCYGLGPDFRFDSKPEVAAFLFNVIRLMSKMFSGLLPVRSRTGNPDPAHNTLWTLLFQMALGCIMLSSVVWENTSAQNALVLKKTRHNASTKRDYSKYKRHIIELFWTLSNWIKFRNYKKYKTNWLLVCLSQYIKNK